MTSLLMLLCYSQPAKIDREVTTTPPPSASWYHGIMILSDHVARATLYLA